MDCARALRQADFYFGAIVASTGLLGTAVGGALLDWQQKGSENTQRERLRVSSLQITLQMILGTAVCIWAVFQDDPVVSVLDIVDVLKWTEATKHRYDSYDPRFNKCAVALARRAYVPLASWTDVTLASW